MKLYNLYKEVIFEEIEKHRRLLTEGASDDELISAIEGEKAKNGATYRLRYNMEYRDSPETPPSKRVIDIYVYGQLDNGNYAIRAWQIKGGSASNKPNDWKIFRVDKIISLTKTDFKWWKPVSAWNDPRIGKYNQNGDNKGDLIPGKVVPTFKRIIAQVKF